MDEYGIVLDFLLYGHSGMSRTEPVAYVLGNHFFSLLEVIVKEGVVLKHYDTVYIGEKERDKIKYIKRKINIDDLSAQARSELENVVEQIVDKNEDVFVNFFNVSGSVTTRLHKLELLPMIGSKHMWNIIKERDKEKFKSFEDIKNRVQQFQDPKKTIIKRILSELEDGDRYKLFVKK